MRTDTELIQPDLHEALLRYFDLAPTGEPGHYRLKRVRICGFFVKRSEGDLICDFGALAWKDISGYHHLFEKLEASLKDYGLLEGEVVVKSMQYKR